MSEFSIVPHSDLSQALPIQDKDTLENFRLPVLSRNELLSTVSHTAGQADSTETMTGPSV